MKDLIYVSYYSKKHQIIIDARVIGKQGNRVVVKPLNRPIESMLVPPSMFTHVVRIPA
jgi:hypothetical protein